MTCTLSSGSVIAFCAYNGTQPQGELPNSITFVCPYLNVTCVRGQSLQISALRTAGTEAAINASCTNLSVVNADAVNTCTRYSTGCAACNGQGGLSTNTSTVKGVTSNKCTYTYTVNTYRCTNSNSCAAPIDCNQEPLTCTCINDCGFNHTRCSRVINAQPTGCNAAPCVYPTEYYYFGC